MSATKEKTKYINELHHEHLLWIKDLGFYKDELNVFKRRLTEIAGMYTSKDVLAKLEHFQNQFILQKEQFDLLQHDINEQESKIDKTVKSGNHSLNLLSLEAQQLLREKVQSAEKIFIETKHGFFRFLSDVL